MILCNKAHNFDRGLCYVSVWAYTTCQCSTKNSNQIKVRNNPTRFSIRIEGLCINCLTKENILTIENMLTHIQTNNTAIYFVVLPVLNTLVKTGI